MMAVTDMETDIRGKQCAKDQKTTIKYQWSFKSRLRV